MIDIEKGESLVDNRPQTNRKYDNTIRQINFLDTRVYERVFSKNKIKYYPSVTSILSACPMDPFLIQWFKDCGQNADIIRTRAAKEGTAVHEAIEKLLAGEKITWQDDFGNARYNLQVWQMILRFQDFYNQVKPKLIASELFLYSDKYKYAGTTDAIFKVGDENWLIDFKTSNALSTSYNFQLAAYVKAAEELKHIHVDRAGILWLKAATRKPSTKPGIYQGEGWQVKFSEDIEADFKAFKHVYEIYKIYNPDIKPIIKAYPTEIELAR